MKASLQALSETLNKAYMIAYEMKKEDEQTFMEIRMDINDIHCRVFDLMEIQKTK